MDSQLQVTKIMEILSCPICMELPTEKVLQCPNGHWICTECKAGLLECPQCRTSYGKNPVRNLLAEGILDEMLFPCTNKTPGCAQTIKRKELAAHHKVCPFRPVKLCHILGFQNCDVETNTGSEFRMHLLGKHLIHKEPVTMSNGGARRWRNLLTKFNTFGDFTWSWISYYDTYNDITQGSESFMLNVKISVTPKEDATFSSVILYLGDDPNLAQKYLGTLKVTMMSCQNQEKCSFKWTGPVLHYKAAENSDMIPYFVTPFKYFKNFMRPEDRDFDLVLSFSAHVQ